VTWVVALAIRGDIDAFCALYREFAPRVYRFCRLRAAQAGDAEDMTQQTFMKAIEALPRYEERGLPFAAWLFRIARNVVTDFERARRDHLDLDAIVRVGGDPASEADVTSADQRDLLSRAMGRLTADQREVLAYRFFADLTAKETGRLMHREPGTIRALQARALRALRRGLVESDIRADPAERSRNVAARRAWRRGISVSAARS